MSRRNRVCLSWKNEGPRTYTGTRETTRLQDFDIPGLLLNRGVAAGIPVLLIGVARGGASRDAYRVKAR